MRRGLISWSKTELPEAVFARRVARAQAALAANGLDAFVTYVNITRPAAASWFTGFVPYWSEGVMVLPQAAQPALVVALSKRVQGWIEATASVASVISTPHFGREAAQRIAAFAPHARVGVLELDALPTRTAAALREHGATLVDATALFERLREGADPTEIALCARAAEMARDALASIDPTATGVHATIANVERAARLAGAEDVFVAVVPDFVRATVFGREPFANDKLGETFAVRLTLAYKGHWVRVVRTVARTPEHTARLARANDRFAAAVAALPATTELAAAEGWLIEGTPRSQPLETLAGTGVAPDGVRLDGKVVSATAILDVDGHRYAAGGVAIVGGSSHASALLAASLG